MSKSNYKEPAGMLISQAGVVDENVDTDSFDQFPFPVQFAFRRRGCRLGCFQRFEERCSFDALATNNNKYNKRKKTRSGHGSHDAPIPSPI
jgi:hypothetical protein